jgi:glycerophosphoryl diester phosphodiesterase
VRYDSTDATAVPLAIAHRGGAGLAAENTIDAFAISYALGIRYLETDVRLTADGVPVLFHDTRLQPRAGVSGRVERCRLGDLPPWVPTLEGVLAGYRGSCFTVDIKVAAAVEPVVEVVRRVGCAARVCVAGAWDATLDQLGDLIGPDLSLAMGWRALFGLVTASGNRSWLRRPVRARFAHVPIRLGRLPIFRDALVERAHDVGVRVVVWTVNDPSTMARLLDAGVDGIITDRPDLLRDVLISRGQWSAPALESHESHDGGAG